MTAMKLVIVCVFLALENIQLADCIKCVWSKNKKVSFYKYKNDDTATDCTPAKDTKCYVDYQPEGSTANTDEVRLKYDCGACPATKYCKDCTGDNCNKASVFSLINDLERDLVPCLLYAKLLTNDNESQREDVLGPFEIFCPPSEKCLKMVSKERNVRRINTFIGCEISINSFYQVVKNQHEFERYECRPNAAKSNCSKLRMFPPPANTAAEGAARTAAGATTTAAGATTTAAGATMTAAGAARTVAGAAPTAAGAAPTAAGAWHQSLRLVSVLLGCTMLLAILLALFIWRGSFCF